MSIKFLLGVSYSRSTLLHYSDEKLRIAWPFANLNGHFIISLNKTYEPPHCPQTVLPSWDPQMDISFK